MLIVVRMAMGFDLLRNAIPLSNKKIKVPAIKRSLFTEFFYPSTNATLVLYGKYIQNF